MDTTKIREALMFWADSCPDAPAGVDAKAALEQLRAVEEEAMACRVVLRDTFAAAALPVLIAKYDGQDGSIDSIPQGAYEYADAMLKAREAK